jgi:hypothetical protein
VKLSVSQALGTTNAMQLAWMNKTGANLHRKAL